MKAYDLLKDENFIERLQMIHKGYIDKMYADAGMQPPIPMSLKPLQYSDTKIQQGLDRLMQGSKNTLYALDLHKGSV